MSRILIAGDDDTCAVAAQALTDHEISRTHDGWTAVQMLLDEPPAAIITDLRLPDLTGLALLATAHTVDPMLPVLIVTDAATVDSAVEALRLGAYDYLLKPLAADTVEIAMERALAARTLREDYLPTLRDLRRINDFKGTVLRSAAHDFKNLLTVIRGYGRLAQTCPEQQAVPECLDRILSASRFMESLAEDLSTYGQLDSNCLTLAPMHFPIVDSIREAAHTVLYDPAQHRIVVQDSPLLVYADRYRTSQILINLLSNAVKYSPRGGDVVVQAEPRDSHVKCSVSDNGLGIPARHVDQLFRPFFRLERDRTSGVPGTGLGLTIVKNLVELQEGEIWVESREGKGTTFHFTLPTWQEDRLRQPA